MAAEPPPVGSLSLLWRGWALRSIEWSYRLGVLAGSVTLLALGGFVPVIRGWLGDEIKSWGGVLEALGGVHVVTEVQDPDGDLGPVLARTDAPPLFTVIAHDDRLLFHMVEGLYSDWSMADHSAELHIFARGAHGFGMVRQALPSDRWIDLFEAWLAETTI